MPELPLSKTRRKKDMHALQKLGEELVGLTAAQLAGLDLPERLAEALAEAKRISTFEARRRQMQFIGRLMRDVDAAPIAARVAELKLAGKRENARHHQVEYWRERLLADEAGLTELARAYPGVDTQRLRTLIRNARKEQAQLSAPHASRSLFRLLRDILAAAQPPGPGPEPL